jgi:MFS family permease
MTAAAQANTTRQPSRDECAFRVAVRTDIPARLDRLPWCRFHVLIVVALGVTWILDGLEVTIVGAIGPVLQDPKTLALSAQQIGAAATSYVVGAVCGALIFGWLTDRSGRRFVFYVTLIVYLTGVLLSATSWSFWSFAAFRAITGLGIGGEYAAINSAIDELIPANYRGRVDLMVNGSFWLGAVAGSGASLVFLDPAVMPVDLGWRFGFAIGGVLGLGILLLRGFVPESPRWLVTHGWKGQADAAMDDIEQRVRADTGVDLSSIRDYLEVYARKSFGLGLILSAMLRKYRERSLLALALLTAQAFLFNAVFFSYGLVLTTFHGVSEHSTGLYLLPLAASNFFGPVLLAPLFDTVGRRKMISRTAAARDCNPARLRRIFGMDADDGLDGDILLRLRSGELGLPDGERDLSVGSARPRDRSLLCARDGHRGSDRASVVWISDRVRRSRCGRRRLRRGGRVDAGGGRGRAQIRDRCGTAAA